MLVIALALFSSLTFACPGEDCGGKECKHREGKTKGTSAEALNAHPHEEPTDQFMVKPERPAKPVVPKVVPLPSTPVKG